MGADGYRHYQIRLSTSNQHFFEWVQANIGTAHIEKANEKWNMYEGKSGHFIASTDTVEIRQVRYGTLNKFQKKVLTDLRNQNVRQIDVYIDKKGGRLGKSWFVNNMWEIRKAHYIGPHLGSGKAIIQDIADKM